MDGKVWKGDEGGGARMDGVSRVESVKIFTHITLDESKSH